MLELAEMLRDLIDGSAPPVTVEEIHRRVVADPRSAEDTVDVTGRMRPRRAVLAAAALLLVVATIGTWVAVEPTGSPPKRAIAPAGTPPTPRWQLTASLSGAQFQLGSGNPGSVSAINCGGGSTCFLSTFYGVGGNTALTGSTYVSHDGGHAWSAVTLPPGVATETSVSCVSATWCAAGGGRLDPATGDPAAKKEMRDPELLVTTDGGVTWSMHALPIAPDVQQLPAYGSLPAETTYWPGIVDSVDCTAIDVCNVVAHVTNSTGVNGGLIPDNLIFLRSTNGGSVWAQTVLPERSSEAGYEVQVPNGNGAALACTGASCVVVSELGGLVASQGVVDAWRTSDRGRSWQETQIAGAEGIYPGLSCPDASNCWVASGGPVLHSTDGGATWSLVRTPAVPPVNGLPGPAWQSIGCTSAKTCFIGGDGIMATTDGGETWSRATVPQGVGVVQSIACEVVGSCIALANPVPPTRQTFSPNGSSLVLTNGSNPTS
jgi:photosystem II stability/assembly factor-like uncharacterized protein